MAHYDLYRSIGLDRAKPSSELVTEIDTMLGTDNPSNPGGREELEVAKAIIGDETKRDMYDTRLDDSSAQEITIRSLRSLAHGPSAPAHSPQQTAGPGAPQPPHPGQPGGAHPAQPAAFPAPAGAPQPPHSGAFPAAGPSGYPGAQAPGSQAPLLPQMSLSLGSMSRSELIVKIGGAVLALCALLLLISIFLKWGAVRIDGDEAWFTPFSWGPTEISDDPDAPPTSILAGLLGVPLVISLLAIVSSAALFVLGKFRNTGIGLLVAGVLSLSITRVPTSMVEEIATSRFVRGLAADDGVALRAGFGAGFHLGTVALVLATIVLLVVIATAVRQEFLRVKEVI